ncbi:hypothetical protein MKX01_000214 [Papaver californicum]|nr:hypothetical protein MKX01_000214 [Papaver californicum]
MEIIPGLLDEIGRQCLIRIPFDQFPTLTSVSRKWKEQIESKEFLQQRKTSGFNQSLIGLIQTHPVTFLTPNKSRASTAPLYRLGLFEPGKHELNELPPIPGCEDGLPRFCHCAGVGRNIVVIGGWNTKTWELLNTVYIYDLITATWRRGVDMPGGKRSSFACASDLNRMVYIAGGHDQDKNTLRSALAYDVLGDVWFSLPDMARPRDECKGLFYGGKFNIIGGYQTEMQGDFDKSAEIFYVDTWNWDSDEKEILETDSCHKTCAFDHHGNLYKCDSAYLSRLHGSTWQRLIGFPSDVHMGTFITTWQDKMFVIGARIFGGPPNCYAIEFEKQKGAATLTKLEIPEEFIGPVQFGCNLEL